MVDGVKEIYVKTVDANNDFDIFPAHAIAINKVNDIAIIKVDINKCVYTTLLSENETIEIGEEIAILGYPFGNLISDEVKNLQISLTKGYISSWQKRNGRTMYFLDIAAKAGNSGSPVVSRENGKVIGVLCGSIVSGREEINYMCPISTFYDSLTEI